MSPAGIPATCESCSKAFRVPDPEKTYACPACKGRVLVETAEVAGAPACRACGAALEEGAGFCAECGESVDVAKPSAASRTARRKASGELIRAAKFLGTLRAFYIANALLYGLATAGAILSFADEDFAGGEATLVLAITATVTALMAVGAIQLRFRPFLWAVLLASLVTVSRFISVYSVDFHPLWTLVSGLWALAFWSMTVPVARVRRLIDEHPDLRISARIVGSDARGNKSPKELARLHRRSEQRANRKSLIVAGLILGISFAGAAASYSGGRTPALDGPWGRFAKDWQGGDADEIASWFPRHERSDRARWLRVVEQNRGWTGRWPASPDMASLDRLDASEFGTDYGIVSDPGFPGGGATWSWEYRDGDWTLTDVVLPDPDFEPAAFEWLEAWEASDYDRLAGHFTDSEKMRGSLRRMAERREWDGLPGVEDARFEDSVPRRRTLYMDTAEGEVRVSWRLVDDAWVAASLKPPPR